MIIEKYAIKVYYSLNTSKGALRNILILEALFFTVW